MASDSSASSGEDEPVKVSLYNSAEVKVALDDHLRLVFSRANGLEEDHRFADVKLALGLVASTLVILGATYGYFVAWNDAKAVTGISVLLYILIEGALVLSSYFVTRDIVFLGIQGKKQSIRVCTSMGKYSDLFVVKLMVCPISQSKTYFTALFDFIPFKNAAVVSSVEESVSCAAFFNTEGYLLRETFEGFLMKLHGTIRSVS